MLGGGEGWLGGTCWGGLANDGRFYWTAYGLLAYFQLKEGCMMIAILQGGELESVLPRHCVFHVAIESVTLDSDDKCV